MNELQILILLSVYSLLAGCAVIPMLCDEDRTRKQTAFMMVVGGPCIWLIAALLLVHNGIMCVYQKLGDT